MYDDSQYASEQHLTSINYVKDVLMSNHNWFWHWKKLVVFKLQKQNKQIIDM